jgi:molybdate transport system ATP-binding protein
MTGPLRVRLSLERAGGFRLDVDLELPGRGITALFGASGSGKTTVLRCVAGLERAGRGRVEVAGLAWQDDALGTFLPAWRRPLGYVFQEASLFDHLDVRRNLAFGLRRTGGSEADPALRDAIELLGIGHLLARRTHELSGGERQRVAIARALATRPGLLLLDEPLSALDATRRQEILPWLERLRDESGLPMLYVTHSADEVARLADTLVLLDTGRALACGPVHEVLLRTELPVVPGEDTGVLLHGTVSTRDEAWQLAQVSFAGGSLWLRDPGLAPGQQVRVRVLARDVSIALAEPQATSVQNLLPCTVAAITPDARQPGQVLVRLDCGRAAGGSSLLARITGRAAHGLALHPGQSAWAQVKAAALAR